MADLDDVRRIARGLPEVIESAGKPIGWSVRGKTFAWERPLRPKDLAELGLETQERVVLCARCTREQKAELVASEPEIFFTTSHFNGFPAVLLWLDAIEIDELTEVLTDGWLCQAPKRLAKELLAERGEG